MNPYLPRLAVQGDGNGIRIHICGVLGGNTHYVERELREHELLTEEALASQRFLMFDLTHLHYAYEWGVAVLRDIADRLTAETPCFVILGREEQLLPTARENLLAFCEVADSVASAAASLAASDHPREHAAE